MIYSIIGYCKCGGEYRVTKKGYYYTRDNNYCKICKPVNADPKKR